ncbi:uncharacterized mitochondrial protein AtMg00310-like [Telopea speciosissima]|uniref:uncharacterized mitochondrial protein AtMg00310-like n=1 Tax=Telopea speciosissima TaxID=54955 RepID=UPI001CC77CD1|nr:uncharacterized mitochondrial protein AtMg00310-like [Telopea speciosissima]
MCFSPNTAQKHKRWLSRVLKLPYGDGPGKYLGLPTEFGVSKAELFHSLSDKLSGKLHGWSQKFLTHAGKEILLKSAALPITNFASSHFKIPMSIHNSIRKEATHFLWGGTVDEPKIHWMSWKRLCSSKERGELGLRDQWTHNKALLSKVAWRLYSDPGSTWAQFMKSIYFPHCDFLEAQLGNSPS